MIKYFLYLFLSIGIWRFIRFITTPILKYLGIYQYHSDLFMTVKVAPKLYEIHLGTSWDFIFHSRINPTSLKISVLDGLLELCEKIELGKFPADAILKGNPYFLKSSSLSRFGFKERKLNVLEYFLTLLSFLESTILLSLSRRELRFANINNNRIVYIKASELVQHKPMILMLKSKMLHISHLKVVPFVENNLPKVNAS